MQRDQDTKVRKNIICMLLNSNAWSRCNVRITSPNYLNKLIPLPNWQL